MSADRFNRRVPARRQSVERRVQRRLRELTRAIAGDVRRIRTDIAASQAGVASEAGIDRAHLTRIEAGTAHPSLRSLVAVATAMGADVSVRLYPGRGPKLDHPRCVAIPELTLRELAPVWRPHLEVRVDRPVRAYIDVVFERRDTPLLVATEYESFLPRLEQQIRWASEKAAAIGSSDLVGPGPVPEVSKLLVLRSTERTRGLIRTFESIMRSVYPARTRDAVDALRTGAPWPGPAIVWIRIEGNRVELLDGPPRGVAIGR